MLSFFCIFGFNQSFLFPLPTLVVNSKTTLQARTVFGAAGWRGIIFSILCPILMSSLLSCSPYFSPPLPVSHTDLFWSPPSTLLFRICNFHFVELAKQSPNMSEIIISSYVLVHVVQSNFLMIYGNLVVPFYLIYSLFCFPYHLILIDP